MRKIKFRAWINKEKVMTGINELHWYKEGVHVSAITSPPHDTGVQFYQKMKASEVILMQYTGLKDKNGKEIYEGDLLEWTNYEGNKYNNIVYWCNGTAYVGWKIKNGKYHKQISPNGIYNAKAKIIGNIYENPELINNTK